MKKLMKRKARSFPTPSDIICKFKGRCIVCFDDAVAVHEIDYRSEAHLDPMREENRVPLCASCHELAHTEGKEKWKPLLRYHRVRALDILSLLD